MVALAGPLKMIRIYSVETGEKLFEMKKHTDWVYAVEFSPDGVLLATADRSGGLFVWEAATAREYLSLRGHNGAVFDVAWRPDSNVLASAGEDATVRLWEMNDGNQIKTWNAHGGGTFNVRLRRTMGGSSRPAATRPSRAGTAKERRSSRMPCSTTPSRASSRTTANGSFGGDWQGNMKLWDTEAPPKWALSSPIRPLSPCGWNNRKRDSSPYKRPPPPRWLKRLPRRS